MTTFEALCDNSTESRHQMLQIKIIAHGLQESMNIAYWATDSDRDYHLKNASRELNRLLEIKNILEGGVL